MCTYSFIADHALHDFYRFRPNTIIWPNDSHRISELERKIASLEELLRRAQKYDTDNNEPQCELDDKKKALKEMAKQLGVEINLP